MQTTNYITTADNAKAGNLSSNFRYKHQHFKICSLGDTIKLNILINLFNLSNVFKFKMAAWNRSSDSTINLYVWGAIYGLKFIISIELLNSEHWCVQICVWLLLL